MPLIMAARGLGVATALGGGSEKVTDLWLREVGLGSQPIKKEIWN